MERTAAYVAYTLSALPVVLRDLSGVAGVGLVGYGAWLWWPPAGFMVAGTLLVVMCLIGTWRGGR